MRKHLSITCFPLFHFLLTLFIHAENILSVILQLASYPVSAGSLMLDGLLNVLCNKNAPFFAKFAHPAYTKSNASPAGLRNPWHRVWCTCIAVVAQLLRTLKFTEDIARYSIEFVNTHSETFWEVVNLQVYLYSRSFVLLLIRVAE